MLNPVLETTILLLFSTLINDDKHHQIIVTRLSGSGLEEQNDHAKTGRQLHQ